jgi:hypothetical protein
MKFFYLFIAITCLVALTILYFQMIVSIQISVPFFDRYINVNTFTLYLIFLSLLSGIFFTLGIKWFLSSSSSIDDDFDL